MKKFLAVCDTLDRMTAWFTAFACMALALLVLVIVVLRYCFGTGFIELEDAARYTFAVVVIFSLPVCLRRHGHVRVEVLSERLSPDYRRTVDAVALVLFLIPVFGLVIVAGWSELAYSWSIREASVETGGLPGLFIVKTALPLGALLMILQGAAAVLEAATRR
ncbi:MAG TPA: TRAP transporter small permease subunit [Arenicellales bacterium]|nr:TRAP transporter small permease subunit [Arenicellales bacterium]